MSNSIRGNEGLHQLLSPGEVANYLGVAVGTLAVWRCSGRYDLPYIKVGAAIRYDSEDVAAFAQSRRRTHTGQEGAA